MESQVYWSGQHIRSPADLPNPGIELRSPALQVDSLPTEQRGKPHNAKYLCKYYLRKKIFQLIYFF